VKVLLIGQGQVGRALSSAFRARRIDHQLLPYRAALPRPLPKVDVVLICTRDGQIHHAVKQLILSKLPPNAVVAHLAGALGPDVLAPLKPYCLGVAQMHPYCSILSIGHSRAFREVPFVVSGDRGAVTRIRQLLTLLEARAIVVKSIDRTLYHLSAALLANGTVALLSHADRLLTAAGLSKRVRPQLLEGLLESVRHNVRSLGPLKALTGPVRRGDVATLERHLALLSRLKGGTKTLYQGVIAAQLDLVKELGELTPVEQRKLRTLLSSK
jgi:predicted short-subunit dehydrogenase-like oxidoreductase (DUF2520 family)